MIRFILFATLIFFGCSKENSNGLENKLKELTKKNLVNSLKSPNSYKPGDFRFITLSEGKTYPYLIDSLYMQKNFEIEPNGDTTYNSYFWVDHIYLATNSFGAEIKGMIRAEYDSHLRLIYFSELSDKDERKLIREMDENGYQVKPLEWK